MKISKVLLIQIYLILFGFSAFAEQAWFGAEWTFTNQAIIDSFSKRESFDNRMELKEKWIEIIKYKCPACEFKGSKVLLPSGLWFEISKDLWVLEVNVKPMTLSEIRAHKEILQDLVWDSAREVGLMPHYRVGGGHIHLDIKGHFKGNQKLFRNFIVDIFNNPELFMGALSLAYLNAPPLAILGEASIQSFAKYLQRFDDGQISFDLLLNGILQSYRLSEDFGTTRIGDLKYHVLNFSHSETLEIRGFRPQVSADHFLLLAEILSKRIKILESYDHNIAFIPKNYFSKVSTASFNGMALYRTQVDPQLVVKTLTNYLLSSGVDPIPYAPYVTEELKNKLDSSVEDLMRGELNQIQHNRCIGFFKG